MQLARSREIIALLIETKNNSDAKRKAITMVDDLKAKGNYQLVDTIKTIEYQILLIILYFVMAVCINW